MLKADISKKCEQFVVSLWGKDGLKQVKERPVTWVRHEANPHLKLLRRKRRDLPLISVTGKPDNRIELRLSNEAKPTRTSR